MTDTGTEINLSIEGMCDFVDNKLASAVVELVSEARRTVSTVEFTFAALLGQSIEGSCDSAEQIEVKLEAYTIFIRACALGTFLEEHKPKN